MYLERKNRIALEPQEVVDLLMAEARKEFGDRVPEDANVSITVDIDDDGAELFKLSWA